MLEASTTLWSSWFHLLITLFEKNTYSSPGVHRKLTNFLECPLIPLVLSARVKTRLTLTSTVRYTSHKNLDEILPIPSLFKCPSVQVTSQSLWSRYTAFEQYYLSSCCRWRRWHSRTCRWRTTWCVATTVWRCTTAPVPTRARWAPTARPRRTHSPHPVRLSSSSSSPTPTSANAASLSAGTSSARTAEVGSVTPSKVSNIAFQFAILIDSIRYAYRFEYIRFVKNRPFDSLVVMQFFLLIYCIVSAKK